jgi:ribonuclease J
MRVRIHRGASEIGGGCVEVFDGGSRLVLDVGLPLDAPLEGSVALPGVAGFDGDLQGLAGVVLSHGHPDHWGLVGRLDPSVRLYVGEVTARILAEAAFFAPTGAELQSSGFLRDGQPLRLGEFTVSPHRVDHSAADAYAIEVEADGKRLLYSGDVRAHGRHGHLLDTLPGRLGGPVDALLLEGTTVGRQPPGPDAPATEAAVEERFRTAFAAAGGMVLACYSPQNVDRLVSLYRASRAVGRTLVLDLYAATIAAASGDPDAPGWDSDGVLIYVPQAQRVKIKNAHAFERVNPVRSRRIYPEQLAHMASELVVTFRASMRAELAKAECLDGAAAVWSLWAGYLSRPDGVRLQRWLGARGINLEVVHASGHAPVQDLQRLAAAIDARAVVPIHTARPDLYESLFQNVERHDDGECWPV